MPYERPHEPFLSLRAFIGRLVRHVGVAAMLVGSGLALGMVGYHSIVGLSWIDSFHNAAMILTGMGPVDPMPSDGAKIFAGCYALFSGLIFITASGVVLAPLVHRVMHRFHFDDDRSGGG